MNKFQKVSSQMARDDKKKEIYKEVGFQSLNRSTYALFRYKRMYPYKKALDFKNWNKSRKY